MSKKKKEFGTTLIEVNSLDNVGVNVRGDIVVDAYGPDETSDGKGIEGIVELSAKELDQIVERAEYERKRGEGPDFPTATQHNGHTVAFAPDDETDGPNEPGDVCIGCQNIAYADLKRVHKLSLAKRARNKRKR